MKIFPIMLVTTRVTPLGTVPVSIFQQNHLTALLLQQLIRSWVRVNISHHHQRTKHVLHELILTTITTTQTIIIEDEEITERSLPKVLFCLTILRLIFKMMSAAATDIIVEIMNKIIDNVDKTVDANKNNNEMVQVQ